MGVLKLFSKARPDPSLTILVIVWAGATGLDELEAATDAGP